MRLKPLMLAIGGYLCGCLWGTSAGHALTLPYWCWFVSLAGMGALGWWAALRDRDESREDQR